MKLHAKAKSSAQDLVQSIYARYELNFELYQKAQRFIDDSFHATGKKGRQSHFSVRKLKVDTNCLIERLKAVNRTSGHALTFALSL
jgi:hypothetical protein